MTETTTGTKEALHAPLDALLVFGSGPVVDKDSREKAELAGTQPGQEDMNFWSLTLAQASTILFEKGQTGKVILMGGKTGGDNYKSEAELIAENAKSNGIPNSAIVLEDKSMNTFENLVNALNLYIDNPEVSSQYQRLGILAQHFHLPRVRLIMDFFDVPYLTAFSSEKVVQHNASMLSDTKTYDDIEQRLDTRE